MRILWIIPLILACGTRPGSEDLDGDGYRGERDCNDQDSSVHPGAEEICDGIDNDCNDQIDEASATGAIAFYADADGDGFGNARATVLACSEPEGYTTSATDCDDTDEDTYPGATELCDGNNNDCDLTTTEEGSATFWGEDGLVYHYSEFGGSVGSPDRTAPDQAGTLRVCEGVHFLEWELEHNLTVVAQVVDPPDAVTFHGGNARTIFRLGDGQNGSGAAVDLTVRGGTLMRAVSSGNGGALACSASMMGGSSVYLLNTVLKDNESEGDGAAVHSRKCALSMIDVEVTGNESAVAAAVYSSGTAVIVDSVFDGNRGGAVSALTLDSNPRATLNGVDFFDNRLIEGFQDGAFATVMIWDLQEDATIEGVNVFSNKDDTGEAHTGGVFLHGEKRVDWIGSAAMRSGVYGNDGVGPGLLLWGSDGMLLSVDGVDFGENGTENDNLSGDVGWINAQYSAPQAAGFVCLNGLCGPNHDEDDNPFNDYSECEIGRSADARIVQADSSSILFGPVIQSDSYATLLNFGAKMSAKEGCVMDWYILSSPTFGSMDDEWLVEASVINEALTEGDAYGEMSMVHPVRFESDAYYALLQAVTCPEGVYHGMAEADRTEADPDPGIGNFAGIVVQEDFVGDYEPGQMVTGLSPRSSIVTYPLDLWVADLSAPAEGVCP